MDEKYVKKSLEELKEELTEVQYKATKENATEAHLIMNTIAFMKREFM